MKARFTDETMGRYVATDVEHLRSDARQLLNALEEMDDPEAMAVTRAKVECILALVDSIAADWGTHE